MRRLSNAHMRDQNLPTDDDRKLSVNLPTDDDRKLSVFKHLFESSNHRDDRKDERKIEKLQLRTSRFLERMKAVNVRMKEEGISDIKKRRLQLRVDDLWVRIDQLRLRVHRMKQEMNDRKSRRLRLKITYLKDKAMTRGMDYYQGKDLQGSISFESACAGYDKMLNSLNDGLDYFTDEIDDNIRHTVKDACKGIVECGRAPTQQLDWDDEMVKTEVVLETQQHRQLRWLDDSDDEEKTEGDVLSGVYGQDCC